LYRNNLSPQTTDRSSSNDFDAKYTEVLIDLGLGGEDPNQASFSGYYQKTKEIFLL
jgi:hypothetical protein